MPGALQRIVGAARADGNAGIVGGLVMNIDGSEQRGCRRREPTPARIARRMLSPLLRLSGSADNGIDLTGGPLIAGSTRVDAVSGAFMLLTRKAMERVGGMDESYFLHFEDLDICRRVRDAGLSVIFCPEALAIHLKSASGNTDRYFVERHKHDGLFRYLEKFHSGKLNGLSMTMVRVLGRSRLELVRWREALRRRRGRARRSDSRVAEKDPRQLLVDLERIVAMPADQWMIMTGASSQVGDFLVKRFEGSDHAVLAVTRGERAERIHGNVWWVKPGFLDALAMAGISGIGCWFHIAPIWLLADLRRTVTSLRPLRLIALSSTSIETKRQSRSAAELRVVRSLEKGEGAAFSIGEEIGAGVTVLRPTMIYGNRKNKNVELVRNWIRWFRLFPLPGGAKGKRQPVHAADVADACLKVRLQPVTFGRIYDLAGAEVIEFQEMIGRIFASASRRPVFIHVPSRALRAILALAGRIPGLGFLTPAMIDRLEQDLVFDTSAARRDFGFESRGFEP
jgi:uncharacterized protein YbjT (DUF2867 family)